MTRPYTFTLAITVPATDDNDAVDYAKFILARVQGIMGKRHTDPVQVVSLRDENSETVPWLGHICLNLHGVNWAMPTREVLDQLIDRYMAAVPNANYHAARDYAERIYSTHKEVPA